MTLIQRALRPPKLDSRLQAVASCLPPVCDCAADIGADHGRLSCHLLRQQRCQHMIVSDISPKALERARSLLTRHGLADRARFVCADGLMAIDEPVDAVIICGMGGDTIAGMLAQAERLNGARLILSAHTRLPRLREAILACGYAIERELIASASGRFYTVIAAMPGLQRLSPRDISLGYRVEAWEACRLSDYYAWRLKVLKASRRQSESRETAWLEEEIALAKRHESDRL